MQQFNHFFNETYPGLNPVHAGSEQCKPGHFWGRGIRLHWLLHYVVSGKGIYILNDQEYKVRAGQIFVAPPYQEIYYQADQHDPWTYVWVAFTTSGDLPLPLDPVINCPQAAPIFQSMTLCYEMNRGAGAYICSKLWELLSILLEQRNPEVNYVEQALRYLNAGYMNENISIGILADTLNINRSYLYSLFKEHTGMSPQQYLIKLRMEKAAQLMTQYHESPTIAANSVGYSDFPTFSKMFKKHFGLSPRAFIQSKQ
ncbi:MAG: helix-turn-helix domain-containing protein [Firmicutes bacterium]|nr:helix-turn-helix domain-containing protein [Bacillota bacterium]